MKVRSSRASDETNLSLAAGLDEVMKMRKDISTLKEEACEIYDKVKHSLHCDSELKPG